MKWELIEGSILVFSCCMAKNYRHSTLKRHQFIVLQFYTSEDWPQRSYLLPVSQSQNQCVGQVRLSPGGFGGSICFQDHLGLGRIHFLEVSKLRSSFPYWLSASGCSEVLGGFARSLQSGPLHLQANNVVLNPPAPNL